MLNRGNYKLMILLPLICFIWSAIASCEDNYYYVCSYDSNLEYNNIRISKVDLDNKNIMAQITIAMHGLIAFRVPIPVGLRNERILAVLTDDGFSAKNSSILDTMVSDFALIDSSMNILRIGQLHNINFIRASSYPPNPLKRLRFIFGQGDNEREYSGRLFPNADRSLRISDTVQYVYRDVDYPVIGGFQHFVQISFDNDGLYWDVTMNGPYLLKIDYDNRSLLDSLMVADNFHHASLFGLSNDSLIYYFSINYNTLDAGPAYNKLTIDPSYLIRYNARNFDKVDSIPIPYPSLDYGYVEPEMGSCDEVGPYLVYYFFEDEGPEIYSPAMLLIFDTRTNEATWLRVGWR
jgi:hypothetical protein